MKTPIGLIIRQLIEEKNLSIPVVAERMGMSRQNVYQNFGRKSLTQDQLEKWANALGVNANELTERQNLSVQKSESSNESVAFGAEVAARIEDHFRKIEDFYQEQLRAYLEQLKAKDQQIEKLLGLLGKSKGAPAGRIVPLEQCEISEAA